MAHDPDSHGLETIGQEFSEYLKGKRRDQLKSYKKQAEKPAAPEKCEACERGDCDNPEHMGEDMAEKLEAAMGGGEPSEEGKPGEDAEYLKKLGRKHAPDSDYW